MTRLLVFLLLGAAAVAPVQAHDQGSASTPSIWDTAAMAGVLLSGCLYAAGSRVLATRRMPERLLNPRVASRARLERTAFWIGLTAIAVAIAPPMDAAASQTFSMHMVQHELLMIIGAPLLVLGRPLVPWLWALPPRLRHRALHSTATQPAVTVTRYMTAPLTAWITYGVVMWVWHAPALYEAALGDEATHALQHVMFTGSAALFWWGLLYGRYGRVAYGASALFVFTTMVHSGMLGAIFALSASPFYATYARLAPAAGVDALADQQLAGLLMWIPAGLVFTGFALALLIAWFAEADRRIRQARPLVALVLVLSTALTACGPSQHAANARMLTGGDPDRGRARIQQYGCDTCHTIPGVATADATVGPPLTGIARRMYLAGRIENTPENMQRWIQHPRAHDPETAMPELGVTDADGRDIVAYLFSLR